MSNPYRAPEETRGDRPPDQTTSSDAFTRLAAALFFMLLTGACGLIGLGMGANPDGHPKAALAFVVAAGLFFTAVVLIGRDEWSYAAIMVAIALAAIACPFLFGWSY